MLDDPLGENGYRIKNQPNCAISRDVAKALPDILNTIRCRMNSAKIELMNASIQRIVSKACGLQDVSYIFAKLRQRFLLNRCIYRQKLMRGLNVRGKNGIETLLEQNNCSNITRRDPFL